MRTMESVGVGWLCRIFAWSHVYRQGLHGSTYTCKSCRTCRIAISNAHSPSQYFADSAVAPSTSDARLNVKDFSGRRCVCAYLPHNGLQSRLHRGVHNVQRTAQRENDEKTQEEQRTSERHFGHVLSPNAASHFGDAQRQDERQVNRLGAPRYCLTRSPHGARDRALPYRHSLHKALIRELFCPHKQKAYIRYAFCLLRSPWRATV